jgi:hypothetical protein
MDERQLLEKLMFIEALHSGAFTSGERDAAAAARERILPNQYLSEVTQRVIAQAITSDTSQVEERPSPELLPPA